MKFAHWTALLVLLIASLSSNTLSEELSDPEDVSYLIEITAHSTFPDDEGEELDQDDPLPQPSELLDAYLTVHATSSRDHYSDPSHPHHSPDLSHSHHSPDSHNKQPLPYYSSRPHAHTPQDDVHSPTHAIKPGGVGATKRRSDPACCSLAPTNQFHLTNPNDAEAAIRTDIMSNRPTSVKKELNTKRQFELSGGKGAGTSRVRAAISGDDQGEDEHLQLLTDEHSVHYHVLTRFNPLLNSLLFTKECPVKKDEFAVCEAAARFFTKEESSLFPIDSSSTEPVLDHGTIVKFAVRQPADFALVNNGCCFNVFANVQYGDELTAVCRNSVVGHPALIQNVFAFNSIFSTGSLDYQFDREEDVIFFHAAVLIGGDWTGRFAARVNSEDTSGGPFPSLSLFVGKDVTYGISAQSSGVSAGRGVAPPPPPPPPPTRRMQSPPDDLIIVDGQIPVLGGVDRGDRVRPAIIPANQTEVAMIKEIISTRVCALSTSIAEEASNGYLDITGDITHAVYVNIRCHEAHCCVSLPRGFSPSVSTVIALNIDALKGLIVKVVKINWFGPIAAGTFKYIDPYGLTRQPLVFNIPEADTINFRVTPNSHGGLNGIVGSIVAPRAETIRIDGTMAGEVTPGVLVGSILAANPKSMIKLIQIETLLNSAVHCRPADPKITMCNCLCKDEKEEKEKEEETPTDGGDGD